MAHVFITYSKLDKATADAVAATLERNGIGVWIAPRDIRPGADWGASIIDAVDRTRVMVLVLSASSNESPQVRREVQSAFERGITVIPFKIDDVVPARALEYYIGPVHWMDASTRPLEPHLQHLVEIVRGLLGGGGEEAGEEAIEPDATALAPATFVADDEPPSPGAPAAARARPGWPGKRWIPAGALAAGVLALGGVIASTILGRNAESPSPATVATRTERGAPSPSAPSTTASSPSTPSTSAPSASAPSTPTPTSVPSTSAPSTPTPSTSSPSAPSSSTSAPSMRPPASATPAAPPPTVAPPKTVAPATTPKPAPRREIARESESASAAPAPPASPPSAPSASAPIASARLAGTYKGTTSQGGMLSLPLKYQLEQQGQTVSGKSETGPGGLFNRGTISGEVRGTSFVARDVSTFVPNSVCEIRGTVIDGGAGLRGTWRCNDGQSGSFSVNRS